MIVEAMKPCKDILRALGLPEESVKSLTISMQPEAIVEIAVTYDQTIDQHGKVVEALKRFVVFVVIDPEEPAKLRAEAEGSKHDR